MIAPEIFKAYDVRGIVGKTLTAEVATLLGRAIGTTARRQGYQSLAVGRDGRISSPTLAEALVQGLLSTGMDVVDVGAVPTPVLSYAIHHLALDGGVMVTGSHNPKDYNGFKITLGKTPLYGDQIKALATQIHQKDFLKGQGVYTQTEVIKSYIADIAQSVTLARPMTIAIDSGNGIGGAVAGDLYRALGCQVIERFCEVDGNFPNHHPDPAKPENLQDLIQTLASTNAEVGLAFDGDADRLGVVTKTGEIIFPDRQLMIFAKDVLTEHRGASIVFDVKCSSDLKTWIQKYHGNPIIWRTGHSYLRAKMHETKSPLSGEMSGHLFFADRWYGFDDGLYAGARLLEILSKEEDTKVFFDALPRSFSTPEINIPMTEGEAPELVEKLIRKTDHFSDAKEITLIDGLRVDYSDGFALARSSNTTPVLVLRFEGKTEAALKRIKTQFKDLLQLTNPDLKISF